MKSFSKINLGLLLAAMMGAVCSCNPDILDPDEGDPTPSSTPVELFSKNAYVAPDVEAPLAEALRFGVKSVTQTPSAGLPLLVVNKLSGLDEALLRDSFESGNTIAVINPVKSEINAFATSRPWLNIFTENIEDGLMLYSFNNQSGYAHLSYPEDKENIDPIELPNVYYAFLSAWLMRLEEEYSKVSGVLGPDDDDDVPDLEKLAVGYKDQVTWSFSKKDYTFRQLLWSDPDKISGNGSMTVNYTVFMAHVYEGQEGSGDYYAVRVYPSIANAEMYRGKKRNRHGGTYVRYCGFICTSAAFEFSLKDENGKDYSIAFAGSPSPKTTNGETEYEDSQSFSLQASQSVTGNLGKTPKGGEGGVQAEVGLTEGWSWSHSERRKISDMDIDEISHGSKPGWSIGFNNLPKFKYAEQYGFDEGNSKAFKSTVGFYGSWIWYDKTGKDNVARAPLKIRVDFESKYKLMSWISSEADLTTERFTFTGNKTITLPGINNSTAGQVTLVNNLPDDLAIYDVEFIDADDGTVYKSFPNTLLNGKTLYLGAYLPYLNYTVAFKARKSGSDTPVNYKYSLHDHFNVTHMEPLTLYANNDFSKQ